jgi:alanine racemase
MGRYGFLPTEIDRILSVYRYLTNLNVTGTYTHYANAFKSVKKTQEQLDAFNNLVEKIPRPVLSLACSTPPIRRPCSAAKCPIWTPSASVRPWAAG